MVRSNIYVFISLVMLPFTGFGQDQAPDDRGIAYACFEIDSQPEVSTLTFQSPYGSGCGHFDQWGVVLEGSGELTCKIYDRWGRILLNCAGKECYWNARDAENHPVSDGIYIYVITFPPDTLKGRIVVLQ